MYRPRHRNAFPLISTAALAVLASLVPVGPANAEDPNSKMVSFFLTRPTSTGTHCPAGWQDYAPLKGRFVFATTDAAGLRPSDEEPLTVGDTPFDPTRQNILWHLHRTSEFLVSWTPLRLKLAWETAATKLFSSGGHKIDKATGEALMGGGWYKEPYEATTFHPGDGSAQLAPSWTNYTTNFGLPAYELKACVQDSATDLTEALPLKSVAFFAGKSCPQGDDFNRWAPHEESSGRAIMALPDEVTFGTTVGEPQKVGYGGEHLHDGGSWTFTLTENYIGDIYWAYAAWNTKKDLLPTSLEIRVDTIKPEVVTSYEKSAFPSEPYDQALVPNVHLLPCIKTQGKVSHKALLALSESYRDITVFRAAQHCDTYWETVEGSSGRLLLGLRDGAEPLHAWGNASTSAELLNNHLHKLYVRYYGTQRRTANGDGKSGTGVGWNGGSGNGYTGRNPESIPPYVTLRHCSLQRQPIPPGDDAKAN